MVPWNSPRAAPPRVWIEEALCSLLSCFSLWSSDLSFRDRFLEAVVWTQHTGHGVLSPEEMELNWIWKESACACVCVCVCALIFILHLQEQDQQENRNHHITPQPPRWSPFPPQVDRQAPTREDQMFRWMIKLFFLSLFHSFFSFLFFSCGERNQFSFLFFSSGERNQFPLPQRLEQRQVPSQEKRVRKWTPKIMFLRC